MFKKLLSLFSKKEELPIADDHEEKIEEAPQEPVQLPDTIEVPWKECAAVKNYEDAITRTHNDFKDFLYNVKMREIQAIRAIDKLEKSSDEKMAEIKNSYLGDKNGEYDFVVPNATGKPGFLKRKKTNK